MKKRTANTTALKVKYLSPTNTLGNRIKLTQMNNKDSIIVDHPANLELIDFVCLVLDKIDSVVSYNIIIDNTQQNYYIFQIVGNCNRIDDYLINFSNYQLKK